MYDQNQSQSSPSTPIGMQPSLPNATTALVLGIISIPTCLCGGIVGLICGIIAIVLGSKAVKLYKSTPATYHISSYNNANAGKICGIIGTALSALYLLYAIIYIIFFGSLMAAFFSTMPLHSIQ